MSTSLGPSDTLQRMMDPPSSGPYYHDRLSLHGKAPGQQQQSHQAIPQSLMHHHMQQQAQAQHVQMHVQAQAQAQAQVQNQLSQDRANSSHVALEALAGSAAEKQSQLQAQADRQFDTKFTQKCPLPECKDLPPFNRPCEYRKHKDKHDRPYVCSVDGCPALGFTYKGGLIRHEKEVHKRNTKSGYRCSFPGCTRVTSFTRRENFVEHLKRIHKQHLTATEIENLRPSRDSSPEVSAAVVAAATAAHHANSHVSHQAAAAAMAAGVPNANGLHSNPNGLGVIQHDPIDPSADLRPRKRHRAGSGQGSNGTVVTNQTNPTLTSATNTQTTANMIMPGNGAQSGPVPNHGGPGTGPNSVVAASMAVAAAEMAAAATSSSDVVRHSPMPQYAQITGDEVIISRSRYLDIIEEMQKLKAANREVTSRLQLLEVQVSNWMAGPATANGVKSL